MAGKLVAKHLMTLADGWHSDGRQGLYLRVRGSSRAWVFRYRDRLDGRLREVGLGSLADVSLSSARAKAKELRDMLGRGIDPLRERRQAVEAERIAASKHVTLATCRERFIEANRAGWRNAKHAQQWFNTLEMHAPKLLAMPVSEIETSHVLDTLLPIWVSKNETANRVRQRVEKLIDWAIALKYRRDDNPARWDANLESLLPKPSKVKKPVPRPALHFDEMPTFMAELMAVDSLASKMLFMQILTATRPSEACGARWDEIDLGARVWTIPGERMKSGVHHRVPLSKPLVEMLEAMPRISEYVFPGRKSGALTTAAGLKLVKEMRPGVVAHGFRSSFRSWCADKTSYPHNVGEAALAHTIRDKTTKAYLRVDLLERRVPLMEDWARFCLTPRAESAGVTPIRVWR